VIVVHGRVQGVQRQLGVAEPMTQFRHLASITVVEVLPRAEDLHRGNARVHDPIQHRYGETVVDKQVCGERSLHSQNPLAVPSARESAAPCSQTPSNKMAAASPIHFTTSKL